MERVCLDNTNREKIFISAPFAAQHWPESAALSDCTPSGPLGDRTGGANLRGTPSSGLRVEAD